MSDPEIRLKYPDGISEKAPWQMRDPVDFYDANTGEVFARLRVSTDRPEQHRINIIEAIKTGLRQSRNNLELQISTVVPKHEPIPAGLLSPYNPVVLASVQGGVPTARQASRQ